MATTVTTPHTTLDTTPHRTGTRFARWGVGAGVAGIGAIVGSSFSGAVYEDAIAGDAVAIADRLSEMTPQILAFNSASMISALMLLVFATGLRQHLAVRLPLGSTLPGVASGGLMLVAVALMMGSGLTTEFVFGVADPELLVPETAAFFGHWIGTIPWLWGGAGLTGAAVAVASLRYGVFARWIGWTSVVLGGLTLLFGISPLQYMAGMTGPLWLTIASAGMLLSRHGRR